jgi:hypothetical protein
MFFSQMKHLIKVANGIYQMEYLIKMAKGL